MSVYKELGAKLKGFISAKTEEVDDKVEAIDKHERYVNTDLDYIFLRPEDSINSSSIGLDIPIPFNNVVECNGLEYNPLNNSVKLKANKTYKITVLVNVSGAVWFALKDITSDKVIARTMYTGNQYGNLPGTTIYTPDNDCEIQLIPNQINGDAKFASKTSEFSYLTIHEINRQIVIDPVEHVNDSQGIEDTPVGHIIAHMGKVAPKHYLICDGTKYNIEDYPYLAQHIEDNFGTINYFGGDGTTTFAVPDLRGEFLRGSGTATRNTGSGAGVGVHQNPTYMPNYNRVENRIQLNSVRGNNTNEAVQNPDKQQNRAGYLNITGSYGTSAVNSAGAYSARPTNTSVLYCIKYEPTYFMNAYNTNYMQPSLYSEEERVIGCWINGKPLYQKTFKTILPEASSNGVMATTTEDCADFNIDIVTSFNGFFASDITTNAAMTLTDGNGFTTSWYNIEQKLLYIGNGTVAWNGRTVYLTIQYTKVTDEENSFTNDMLKDSYVELTYSDEEISTMVADILGGEE